MTNVGTAHHLVFPCLPFAFPVFLEDTEDLRVFVNPFLLPFFLYVFVFFEEERVEIFLDCESDFLLFKEGLESLDCRCFFFLLSDIEAFDAVGYSVGREPGNGDVGKTVGEYEGTEEKTVEGAVLGKFRAGIVGRKLGETFGWRIGPGRCDLFFLKSFLRFQAFPFFFRGLEVR